MINKDEENKAIITIDDDGYVVDYIIVGGVEGGIEVDRLPNDEDVAHLNTNSFRLVDGKLEFDEARYKELELDRQRHGIRLQREEECFPIINRGGIWYELLSDENKIELMAWYQAWLDATETLIIPEKPTWI